MWQKEKYNLQNRVDNFGETSAADRSAKTKERTIKAEKEKLEENISTMSNPVQTVNISKTSTEASTSLINSNPILNLGSDMHKIKPRPNLDIA